MLFPDPNIGYLFGYESKVTKEGLLVTFLGGRVKKLFRFEDIESVSKDIYDGGRISWNVIRWGKCPFGTDVLRVVLKKGLFREHLLVFDDIKATLDRLPEKGVNIV